MAEIKLDVIAPYTFLLAPSQWGEGRLDSLCTDPSMQIPLYKYTYDMHVHAGVDDDSAKDAAQACVWTACCARDTKVPMLERLRRFVEAGSGVRMDWEGEMYELALQTQAILWGNCLKEPDYNLTRMCDAVAKVCMRLLDRSLGKHGEVVKIDQGTHVSVTSSSHLSERGLELSVSFDPAECSEHNVRVAMDQVVMHSVIRAAESLFEKEYSASFDGDQPGPDVMQRDKLYENLRTMKRICRKAASARVPIFTGAVDQSAGGSGWAEKAAHTKSLGLMRPKATRAPTRACS
mmetsp:Transcript_45182/g.110019  ORF Transcript_45182/g.110019 Transcript_45182/m.110019 type:complete len:291 (+) Transcript_45182:233-1105(+)|eukprot:CAMPEP_0206276784 /NCGR_PEP_ID=MMETSP0047_2-20121206/36491_1 /ASSEMBLY_ACC=CAM_ASM_000192 /TAXON_ID=195065 /ORGANISM="Chroomonas mesostigmatica_cf, Strain CCMP1168" /LENGTH=290 /DNA_ID=CAMNT_0053706325 /DNA_START=219 /DNA_END=1091 /DNA_ORIENTATION=+